MGGDSTPGGANSDAINLPLRDLPARKDMPIIIKGKGPIELSILPIEALKLPPLVKLVYKPYP